MFCFRGEANEQVYSNFRHLAGVVIGVIRKIAARDIPLQFKLLAVLLPETFPFGLSYILLQFKLLTVLLPETFPKGMLHKLEFVCASQKKNPL